MTSRLMVISCSESGRLRNRCATNANSGMRDSRDAAAQWLPALLTTSALRREGELRLTRDESDELVHRHGLGEIEALHLVAAFEAQELHLLARLHAFGDHLELQAVPEADDGAHDHRVVGIGGQIAHEALVDLQPVDRELLHVSERRIAGAEIVDRDFYAEIAQLLQVAGH